MNLWKKLSKMSLRERMEILFASCSAIAFITTIFFIATRSQQETVIIKNDTRPAYNRKYFYKYRDEVKLDQLLVLDQILLTLKDIDNTLLRLDSYEGRELTTVPGVLDLTNASDTH
jgi:hypothetical protein